MARIDWAVLCDLAFMDRLGRLCVIGVTREFFVPALPIALHQVVLVAHLTDVQPIDTIGVGVFVVSPHGVSARPKTSDSIIVELSGEYVLATLRNVPLTDEGMYRFDIALTGQTPTSVVFSVLAENCPSATHCQ
jgi:hypothetical protein